MFRLKKTLSVILITAMVLSMMPSAYVSAEETGNLVSDTSALSVDDAGIKLREYMRNRTENASLSVCLPVDEYVNAYTLWEELCNIAYEHTGDPKEGDYLYLSVLGSNYPYEIDFGGDMVYITYYDFSFDYMLTVEEEAELDLAIGHLLGQLNLSGKSDYDIAFSVYDYVCKNVSYDYENTSDTSNSSQQGYRHAHSAYGALINGKAVCQGYALLIYRLLLELGVECRAVAGSGHAWNTMRINGVFYNADATNDIHNADSGDYALFLKGSSTYQRTKIPYERYREIEYYNTYEVSPLDYSEVISLPTYEPDAIIDCGQCGENANWELRGDGTLTVCGSGLMYDYDKYTSPWNGKDGLIKTVIIAGGIENVGDYAFYNCPILSEVVLADTVNNVGTAAFRLCTNLKEITLPANITIIQDYAFSLCVRLENVILSTSLVELCNDAFDGCSQLSSVHMFTGLTKIGDNAFSNCRKLQSIEIPNTVTEIGKAAFAKAFPFHGDHEIFIPDSVEIIGSNAFAFSGLENIILSNNLLRVEDNTFYHAYDLQRIELPNSVTYIGTEAFSNCTNMKAIEFSDNITHMGNGALTGCESLTEVILPRKMIVICDSLLSGCSSLKSITIPDSIVSIENSAFNGTIIEEITLPQSLENIGAHAFASCEKLGSITIPSKVNNIGEYAFGNCTHLLIVNFECDAPSIHSTGYWPAFKGVTASVYYPAYFSGWTEDRLQHYGGTLTWIPVNQGHLAGEPIIENYIDPSEEMQGSYDSVLYCTSCGIELHRATFSIPIVQSDSSEVINGEFEGITWQICNNTLTITGSGDMPECSEWPWHEFSHLIYEVVIEKGITSVGTMAFYDHTYLQKVVLPEEVTTIGYAAFYQCTNLINIILPESLTTIRNTSFAYCRRLKELIIPNGVRNIEQYAFNCCTMLSEIELPDSVEDVGNGAFAGCSNVVSITISAGMNTINQGTFSGCQNVEYISIPENITEIGQEAFSMCSSLTEIIVPGSVTVIGKRAFSSCASLESAVIGESVASIGSLAFELCWNLKYVQFTGDMPVIADNTFCYVYDLECYYPANNETWNVGDDDNYGGSITWKPHCLGNHTEVVDLAVEATCTETGLTEGRHCSACDVVLVAQEDIPAKGHIFGGWTTTKAATCTEDGMEQRDCDRCDHFETRATTKLGHDYQSVVTDPTCTEDGYTVHTCSRCNDTYTDSPVDALGHDLGAWYTVKDAACTEDGQERRDCSRCDHYETRDVAKLGHDYESVITDPTCTEGGYTTHTCSRCGDSYKDSPVKAPGHDYKSEVKEADCNRGGYTIHTCDRCGDCYTTDQTEPLGHSWGEWIIDKEPGCMTDGFKHHDCTRCGTQETYVILFEGHIYEDGICKRCGGKDPNYEEPDPVASGVIRLKGKDRYLTAFAVANQLKEKLGVSRFETVVVAYGRNFPDALTGSYLAAVMKAPILLTEKSADSKVLTYIEENLIPGGKVYILGGTAAVTESFEIDAKAKGFDVERLKDKDRYGTNLAILREAEIRPDDEILIATGTNYADSLSASATGLPMLLVGGSLTEAQKAFLATTSGKFVIIGGTGAVSQKVEDQLNEIGTAVRVKGKTRYETSVVIAQRFFDAPKSVALAYAQDFPDGLCGGPLAYVVGAPLILTSGTNYASADSYIEGMTSGFVTGGTGRLTDEVVRKIFDLPEGTEIPAR